MPQGELSGDQAKVYELVVRRFLATLMPAAVIEGQRLDVTIGDEPFLARGSRVAEPGFLEVYEKYAAKRDRPAAARWQWATPSRCWRSSARAKRRSRRRATVRGR